MFKIPIYGEIDGKPIKVIMGSRYRIYTDNKEFEGTVVRCANDSFLIKTVDGGFFIDFALINDIKEI